MTVTEEDLEDDAEVKAKAGPELKGVLARDAPELNRHFEQVCHEELGMDPGVVLARAAIRAIENEEFRDRLQNTEVSLQNIKINQIREEDLDFVMDLHEKFGDEPAESKVDKFIDDYMDQQSSLFGNRGGSRDSSGSDKRLEREIQEIKQQLDQMAGEQTVEVDEGVEVEPNVESKGEREEKVRDLFEGREESDGKSEEEYLDTEEMEDGDD